MNQSIYLMLAVPYTAAGVFGFLIYRGVKKNAEYVRAMEQPPPTSEFAPEADGADPTPPTDG
jgi:hypothetical protein